MFLTTPPGDQTCLFVVEQGGTIRVLDRATGSVLSTFLTVTGITSGGERGLLGLAFDPNYNANDRCYVNYTDANGAIARFVVSAPNPNVADPNSRVILVSIPHPRNSLHKWNSQSICPQRRGSAGVELWVAESMAIFV
ncbi:MAG: PQQ-dependent sugar dehydrogenase [Nitrospirae bacterium]|nr:PQQ-dependent sugar dehydrogenase [Nitrospirota bacterium]